MKVKDILSKKGPQVFTIGDQKHLGEAIEVLVNNNIGSLIVLNENGKISGIVTERDVLRESHKSPGSFRESAVKDVMTKKLIIVEPDDEMDYVESVMTNNRIRHLPVVKDGILVGMISIGDVVKNQLSEVRHNNKYLLDYIGGNVS